MTEGTSTSSSVESESKPSGSPEPDPGLPTGAVQPRPASGPDRPAADLVRQLPGVLDRPDSADVVPIGPDPGVDLQVFPTPGAAAEPGPVDPDRTATLPALRERRVWLPVRVPGQEPAEGDRWLRIGMAGIGVVLLLAALGAVVFSGADEPVARPPVASVQPGRTQPSPAPAAPTAEDIGAPAAVLADSADTAPMPSSAGVARALTAKLADPRLGARVGAHVVDVATGTVLLDRAGGTQAVPASTAKLLTATALLSVLPGDTRLRTRVVSGSRPGEVVLVGGGDPTLSNAAPGRPTLFPGAARLGDLATTVKAVGKVTRVVVDSGRFTGPRLGPGWDPADVDGGFVSEITSLMTDGGRADPPNDFPRSPGPDLAAGRAFAARLGLPASAVVRGTAPAGARQLATVESAPLSTLIEQMLLRSDNVVAEVLVRQVAIAEKQPPSFAGAAAAVRQVLARIGVPTPGVSLVDGSGLSRQNRVAPAVLTAVLRTVVSVDHPTLHGVVPGLPVGGYDGTLNDRFEPGSPSRAGAGVVRAKTGTLTGVSALAGVLIDADGRLLVFAVLADQVSAGSLGAEEALDETATTLARCGCQ